MNSVIIWCRWHGSARRLAANSKSMTLQAIKNFPEVFGLDVENQMRANVEKLKKDWKMTDKVIPNVVKRQPQVLGYNVDCEGNCMGECNRCWIRL